jgi:hypothetical protein
MPSARVQSAGLSASYDKYYRLGRETRAKVAVTEPSKAPKEGSESMKRFFIYSLAGLAAILNAPCNGSLTNAVS